MVFSPSLFHWRRRTTVILTVALVAGLVYLAGLYAAVHFKPTVEVRVGSGIYQLWLADTEGSRTQGLSHMSTLQKNNGLLLKFESNGVQSVWMNDVTLPLDIVWINDSKSIVSIIKNVNLGVSKDNREAGIIDEYTSGHSARYALEIPAGSVAEAGINVGDTVAFDENSTEASFTWSR